MDFWEVYRAWGMTGLTSMPGMLGAWLTSCSGVKSRRLIYLQTQIPPLRTPTVIFYDRVITFSGQRKMRFIVLKKKKHSTQKKEALSFSLAVVSLFLLLPVPSLLFCWFYQYYRATASQHHCKSPQFKPLHAPLSLWSECGKRKRRARVWSQG